MPEPTPDETVLETATADHRPIPHTMRHPPGLLILILTEAGLAFSLYGIESLLVLYLKHHLLQSHQAAGVWGMPAAMPVLTWLYGAHGITEIAAAITGLFLALLYATPLLGGLMADRYLGRTFTVVIGGICLVLGMICLAWDATFLVALFLLLIGLGCTRGILPAQVGALYAGDDPRRADAFQLFVLGIQIAVIASPGTCSWVATTYGWHAGFLVAGVGITCGLLIYLAGRRFMPADAPKTAAKAPLHLTASDKRNLLTLLALLPTLALATISNTEIFNGYLLWGDKAYHLTLFGIPITASSLVSLDGLVSTCTTFAIVFFWRQWNLRRSDPGEMNKMLIGCGICTIAPTLLAAGAWLQPGSHNVSLLWGVAFHLVNDIGFGMSYPVGMALFSRLAPKGMDATIVAGYSLHLFLGFAIVGKVAGLVDVLPAPLFWLAHVGIALIGMAALVVIATLRRKGAVAGVF